jgi:hypothetical protein
MLEEKCSGSLLETVLRVRTVVCLSKFKSFKEVSESGAVLFRGLYEQLLERYFQLIQD